MPTQRHVHTAGSWLKSYILASNVLEEKVSVISEYYKVDSQLIVFVTHDSNFTVFSGP